MFLGSLLLRLYYYLSILDVMIRLPLVLVWAWCVLLTDCTIVLSPVYFVLTLFVQINDDDEIGPYLLLIGNKKSQVASRSVLIPMTLSDLERRDATDQIFWQTSVITLVSFPRERPNRHLWGIFSESATPPLPRRWSPASPHFLAPFYTHIDDTQQPILAWRSNSMRGNFNKVDHAHPLP